MDEIRRLAPVGAEDGDVRVRLDGETAVLERLAGALWVLVGGASAGRTYPVPVGAIVAWWGEIGSLPEGYVLCDGTNGTPDLRGRFVVGAGGTYAPGATGGAATVALTEATMPGHVHTYPDRYWVDEYGVHGITSYQYQCFHYTGSPETLRTSGSAGGGQPHENRPPYKALYWLKRVS
jgi:hypothetical protein